MKRLIGVLIVGLAAACAPRATLAPAGLVPESRYFSTNPEGAIAFSKMIDALSAVDVVFFGEQHDDPATHRAELAVLAAIGERRANVVLSLEMFERDVQPVLDAYLVGAVTEAEFLAKSRPWPRYATDYRAMVELAKARGWRVVASNVPRPLASAVGRKGLRALDTLSAVERLNAAREIVCPRDTYYANFAATMTGHDAGTGPASAPDTAAMRAMTNRFYEAQCVKDETMAESVTQAFVRAGPGAIVVHYDGAFHSDFGLGTAERTRRRLPNSKTLVVTAVPVPVLSAGSAAAHRTRADFVILTPAAPAK